MKKTLTYEELLAENQNLRHRIMMLERMLFGSKKDRPKPNVSDGQPGLFDDFFQEAVAEKEAEIKETAEAIEKEADKRREKARKAPSRPQRYQYYGLEERVRIVNPDGLDLSQYEMIGKDCTRILRFEPAKLWVDVIITPIYRHKSDKNQPNPQLCQAKAPQAVIGGNHVGAELLAKIVTDKFRHHLPEYRQVRQYADLGLKLPASTINDWVHAVAAKLDPVYEAQRKEVLQGDYLQIDEVPWNIIDKPGKQRKGYAWQFLDNRPDSH